MLDQAEKYARAHRRRTRWHKVTTVMASIVVFGTTYALILPAITQERTTCGLVEHIHDDSCYREIPAVTRQELVCSEDSLNIHQHTKECYDEEKNLICGYADFIAHKHDDTCYDESGNLVCTLPEIEAHTHDNSCYAQPVSAAHVHTEDCYTLQPVFLVCTETEGEGHIHTADCYTETTYLSCMFSDVEGHEHGPECYETVTELTCGQSEGGGHVHGEDCYVWDEVLTCEYADVTPEEPELICNKEEIVLHKHTKDCYDEDGNLICGKLEVLEHKHTEDCFQTVVVSEATRELICEKPEHTHDSSCYPETEKITETQTEELTGAATEAQTEKLTEAETEAETGELAEAESESETEESTELVTEAETEDESEELTEVESESESEEESETETEEADVLDEEFRLTAQAESGIEVTVSGPVTSLPYPVEEISLTVEEVTDEEVLAIWKQTLEEAGANAEEAFLLDITLWHDEEEIEPIGPVQVTFAGVETGEDDEFTVFHVDTENENAEDMNAVVDEEGAVVLDTDHFSVYGGLVSVSGVTRKPKAGEYIYVDMSKVDNWANDGYKLGLKYNDSTKDIYDLQNNSIYFKELSRTLYRIKLPDDIDTSKTFNIYRTRADHHEEFDSGKSFVSGSNFFAMSGYWNGYWVEREWYIESLAGKRMAFENNTDTTITGVTAIFFDEDKQEVSRITIGDVTGGGGCGVFEIPDEYGTYVQFVDGSGIILGDTYSNFLGGEVNGTDEKSFVFDVDSMYCYKYNGSAENSKWGVPGNGDGIYFSSANGHKQLDALSSAGTYYLAENVDWGSTINITGDVTLDLRGHQITTTASLLFNVTGTLTIIDTGLITDEVKETSRTITYGNENVDRGSVSYTSSNYTNGTETKNYKQVNKIVYYEVTSSVNPDDITTTEEQHKHEVTLNNVGGIYGSGSESTALIQVDGGTLNIEGGTYYNDNGKHTIYMNDDKDSTFNLSGGIVCGRDLNKWYDDGNGNCIYVGGGRLNISGDKTYVVDGHSSKGGGIYMKDGTINMSGGVVAVNRADNGGGIYVNAGTLNLSDGKVATNRVYKQDANCGGGIYMNEGTLSMSGGYVTCNRKDGGANNGAGQSGGGGIAFDKAKMYMSGGFITGNYSQEAGGGVYAGFWVTAYTDSSGHDRAKDNGARFIMSGGTIASNYANQSEGGGLRISGGAQGEVSAPAGRAIYITNNKTNTYKDWGGGGIFVQTDGLLNILDVLITKNDAEGFGGGVASCPSGDVDGVSDKGAAIFDNKAKCTNVRIGNTEKLYDVEYKDGYLKWGNDGYPATFRTPYVAGSQTPYDAQDYFTTGSKSTMKDNQDMIGGGIENWSSSGKSAGIVNDFKVENETVSVWALTSNATDAAKAAAKVAASVFVTGNWSNTHGGGITTNGGLDMGKTTKTEHPTFLTLNATKQVQKANYEVTSEGIEQFTFVLLNTKPTWDKGNSKWLYGDDAIVQVVTGKDADQKDIVENQVKKNNTSGYITFDKIKYDVAGYYIYYLIEGTPGDNVRGNYDQDPTLYTIGVSVTSTTTTNGNNKDTTYTIEKVEVNSKAITIPDGDDKTIAITNADGGKTFTNKEIAFYSLPSTGGIGTTLYTLGGLLLMAVAEFFLLYNYKKRRKEDGASS